MKAISNYKIRLLLLLAASMSLSFIDRVNLSVVLPELIKEHSYTPSSAGLLMSLLNFFNVGAIIFAGPLTDRIGATRAFPIAVAGWSLATGLCALTVQFWPLAALRALVGIGESPNIPAGSQVIKHNFDKTERGFAVSAQFSGTKIGLAVGIPLSSFLLATFGRPCVFIATGLLGAFWVVAWLLIYKRPADEATTYAVRAQSNIRWSSLLKVRSVWGMVLGQAGYLYIYYVFVSWLPGYLALKHNLPTLSTGFLAMLPFVSGIAFTIFGGWASDRLIAKGYSISLARKSFALGGIFGASIFTVIVALSQETWVAVAAVTAAVSMISLTAAPANAMPIDVAPPHLVSSCASIQNVGGNLGGAFAPLVMGLLISHTGGFTVPLLFTALVGSVLGCVGYGLILRNLDREIDRSDFAFDIQSATFFSSGLEKV